MMQPTFVFTENDNIGRVASVDTVRVEIDVTNPVLLTHINIGQLIAIRGATEREYLIGMTDRVSRSMRDELPDPGESMGRDAVLTTVPNDIMQAYLIGTFRTIDGERVNTFKRGADSFPQIDRECFVMEGANLERFMGILAVGVAKSQRLKLGTFVANRSADAIANGDKFFQRHAAILGSTGSGKSWAVALILERASRLEYPNILVLDMHGEYAPLARAESKGYARRFRIAGPGDLEAPEDDVLFLPYWLLNRDEMLSMILDRSDQNAPNQASRFTLHVRTLKAKTLESENRELVRKTFTVDSPIPYEMQDLIDRLNTDNITKGIGKTGNPIKGEWEGKLTRFLSRLEAKVEDRRYGFMFSPPPAASKYQWLADQAFRLLGSGPDPGIKVVDFSEVPADVLPVVTGTLARFLYDVQFWMNGKERTPVSLLCDEAHLYLPVRDGADAVQRQALGAFERIAKEGRKYGFSLLVVSQRPSDVSRTILSQCNNFLALRLTNETDQSVIKRLMPDSLVGLTNILPLLDTGEALLLGDSVLLPSRIKLDIPTITPDSATRDFWKEWGVEQPSETAVGAAVERLRSQSRI